LFRFTQILKEQTTGSAPVPARFEDTVGSQVVVVLLALIGFIGFTGLLLYLIRKLRKAN
jgi:flagellar biogenesis protein FliO